MSLWDFSRTVIAGMLVVLFALPPQNAAAQSHILSPSELRQQVVNLAE